MLKKICALKISKGYCGSNLQISEVTRGHLRGQLNMKNLKNGRSSRRREIREIPPEFPSFSDFFGPNCSSLVLSVVSAVSAVNILPSFLPAVGLAGSIVLLELRCSFFA